jgi:hypothetical protein
MEDTNIQPKKTLLSSKEIVARARKFYKENFKKLWPLYILGGLGSGISFNSRSSGDKNTKNIIPQHYLNVISSIPLWVWVLVGILVVVIAIFLFISKISLLKSISDTRKNKFVGVRDSYNKGLSIFWSFVLITFMVALSCLGAFVLLIIPGIILSVYLIFSLYELVDKQKTGFQALLGSWSLISGYWWLAVGKAIMIGLRITLIGLLYFLATLVLFLIFFVPGMIFHIPSLMIASALWFVFLFIIAFGFLVPLSIIAMFEMYYSFCDIRESNNVADEALDEKRMLKLKTLIIIGVIVPLFIILTILFIHFLLPVRW